MSDFEKLMAELNGAADEQESLIKAMADSDSDAGSDKIQAAAADGGADGGDGVDGGADDGGDDEDEVDENGEPITKSFRVKLENGEEVEAIDGAKLLKSLQDRVNANAGEFSKAMESMVTLIKGQNSMIKSMQAQIKDLSEAGRGRKAVLTVNEKAPAAALQKSQSGDGALTGDQFMAKALDAQKAGRINGVDVSTAEACLNRGIDIPPHIVSRVLQ